MFFTDNQLEILNVFFSQPDAELHMNALGRILGKKPGTFQKGLNALEKEGIIKSRMRGNQRLICLNKDYPFLKEIRHIVENTAGIPQRLSHILHRLDDVELAFIFGSFVQNKMRPGSDIDLVIVCSTSIQGKILKEIGELEDKILREINPKFYTSSYFAKKRKTNDPFLDEIVKNKIIILKGSL